MDCEALEQDGERLALATNVMAGVAGALATATLTAFFVEGRKRSQRPTAWAIGPIGVTIRGSF